MAFGMYHAFSTESDTLVILTLENLFSLSEMDVFPFSIVLRFSATARDRLFS